MEIAAGVAASHPDTAAAGLRMLKEGGSAADAAVAAVLTACVAETIFTGLGGGGFATYFDAATGTTTCLDFFVAMPGLDGDRAAGPMLEIEVAFGGLPQEYSIGGASVAVPGVPKGCGEVHRRWGRLPWESVVAPARELAATGSVVTEAHARTLDFCLPALAYGEGSEIYQPGGKRLAGGDLLRHPGLDAALGTLAAEGPDAFYTGSLAALTVGAVRDAGGSLGPRDLAEYRVLETAVDHAVLGPYRIHARHDLSRTIETVAGLPPELAALKGPERAVTLAASLRDRGRQRIGDTTNVSVVDAEGNACVITTTLGLGSAVWLPGLGINLNSMLGEGELLTGELAPGERMSSNMCPLVATDGDGRLIVAAGSAGASRIRGALIGTLLGVLVDGLGMSEAIARPRLHVVDGTAHVEPGFPEDEVAALSTAGWTISRWPHRDHYFGGVTAVGAGGAAGDPRRGGMGLTL
jgi:gamma-glutamyltranspeptidase / glutathione hydrolase